MNKKIFAVRVEPKNVDIVLLLLRLVMGCAFILHGLGKIQMPFGWMGPESPVPAPLQGLAALAEFGGGIALVLGLVTRLAALGISCTMLVAVIMHKFVFGDPFVPAPGGSGYELALVYFVLGLFFIVMGPGRFSLDQKVFGKV